MVGIRKRLVRYRLFPRNFNLQKIKNDSPAVAREQLWGWRRTTFTNRNRSVLIRPYGFNFNGAIRKYVRKQKVAKLVVTVANERQRCNNYNIKHRTKYLRFTPRIIRGLGLNR
jgi:hypothetical protein